MIGQFCDWMRVKTKPRLLLTRLYISETFVAPLLALILDFISKAVIGLNHATLLPRGIDTHTFILNDFSILWTVLYIEVGDGTKVSPAIKRRDYLLPPPLQDAIL